jgi:hypothetical protein
MRTDQRLFARLLVGLAALLALGACHRSSPKGAEEMSLDLPFKELMAHVVQPAAFGVWKGSGYKETLKGEVDLGPKSEDDWVLVENGAATVAEAGNLLKLNGRIRAPEKEWTLWADALTRAGLEAKAAAEAKDEDRVFAAGVSLEAVCTGCHSRFMPGGEGGPPLTPPPRRPAG